MKKLVIAGLIVCGLIGCSGGYSDGATNRDIKDRFVNIREERYLFFDKNTHIVYYFINGFLENDGCYSMPYISENGKFCKYENGMLIEVE